MKFGGNSNCRGQSKIAPNLAIDHDNENFTLTPYIGMSMSHPSIPVQTGIQSIHIPYKESCYPLDSRFRGNDG